MTWGSMGKGRRGMLTATVPVDKAQALVQDLREANAFPVGLARTP